MATRGLVLGPGFASLVEELTSLYVAGELVVVAGAGASRAAELPGWEEMVAAIQTDVAATLAPGVSGDDLERVLLTLHGRDPIARADSLQRLTGVPTFRKILHAALYPVNPAGDTFRPSVIHWHVASLIDHQLMPDAFTSNYDDLLEDAKQALGRSGRVRHFHGRLPQGWPGDTRLGDPPVITSRDYMAAEGAERYTRFEAALRDKTVLLVGFSLADPNLAGIIRSTARDCHAVVVASPKQLPPAQQRLRLNLLRRYWQGLNISVTAIEAREELGAFLLALRRRIMERQGRTFAALASNALRASAIEDPWTWTGARELREALRDAVVAAKAVTPGVRGDATLAAGFYAIEPDGLLAHVVGSKTTQNSFAKWPRRRLIAEDSRPWGAAGYSYAAGVPVSSSATGGAFDRNVPEDQLRSWQLSEHRSGGVRHRRSCAFPLGFDTDANFYAQASSTSPAGEGRPLKVAVTASNSDSFFRMPSRV